MNDFMDAMEAYIDARITLHNMRVCSEEYDYVKRKCQKTRRKLIDEIRELYADPSTILFEDGNSET